MGAPSLFDMTARRGLNLAFAYIVENMDKDERESFLHDISLSMVEWLTRQAVEQEQERQRRRELAAQLGEVG